VWTFPSGARVSMLLGGAAMVPEMDAGSLSGGVGIADSSLRSDVQGSLASWKCCVFLGRCF